jgi:hypothetical protein
MWHLLRAACAFTAVEETALRQLAERTRIQLTGAHGDDAFILDSLSDAMHMDRATHRQRVDADVARHGLRACALPECDAVEPHPKTFKICSRCRAVCYCSAAHQAEDWKRHKREDGCKAPPA